MEENKDLKTLATTGGGSKEYARGEETPHGNPFEASAGMKWSDVPVGFYLLAGTMSSLYLASLVVPLDRLLMNMPEYTLFFLNFWRVLVPFLVTPDPFTLLFTLLALYMMSITEEKFTGSARYLLEVLYRSLAIQLVFTCVGAALWLLLGLETKSFGVWPVYMVIITLRCLEFPEKETYLFLMYYPIKNKHYPPILLLLFLPYTFFYGLSVDIWVGFSLAHLMNQSSAVEKAVDPSPAAILAVEKWLTGLSFSFGSVITEAMAGEKQTATAGVFRSAEVQQGQYFAPPEEGQIGSASPQQPQSVPPQHLHSAFRGAGLVVGGTAPFAANSNYPSPPAPESQITSSLYPSPQPPADRHH